MGKKRFSFRKHFFLSKRFLCDNFFLNSSYSRIHTQEAEGEINDVLRRYAKAQKSSNRRTFNLSSSDFIFDRNPFPPIVSWPMDSTMSFTADFQAVACGEECMICYAMLY